MSKTEKKKGSSTSKPVKEKKRGIPPFLAKIFFVLLFIAGALVTAYPFYRDSLNNMVARNVVEQYQSKANANFQKEHMKLLEKSRQSSEQMKKALADPFSKESLEKAKHDATNAPTELLTRHTIGVVYIPKINQQLPIYDSTEETYLSRGAAWVSPSDLPTGGVGRNTVISAHRGLPTAKLFTDLPKMEKNDIFIIQVNGEYLAYKVCEIKVVKPEESDVLLPQKNRDLATLLTCTPYMVNSHRLLVIGERTPFKPNMVDAINKINDAQNMQFYYVIAGVVLALFIGILLGYRSMLRLKHENQRFDIKFKAVDSTGAALEGKYVLMDARGKKPKYRDGKPVEIPIDEKDGHVELDQIPGITYQLHYATPDGKVVKENLLTTKLTKWQQSNFDLSLKKKTEEVELLKDAKKEYLLKKKKISPKGKK